jgi:hypothetical protein
MHRTGNDIALGSTAQPRTGHFLGPNHANYQDAFRRRINSIQKQENRQPVLGETSFCQASG